MGKMKQWLEENMKKYPELYDGSAEEDFWIQCRKDEILEREGNVIKIKGDKVKCQLKSLKSKKNKK